MAARPDAHGVNYSGAADGGGAGDYLEFDMTTAGLIIFVLSLLALCIRVVRNPFVRDGNDMFYAVMAWVGLGLIVVGLL